MEDELLLTAWPVRVEGHALRPAGLVVGAHAGDDRSDDRGLRDNAVTDAPGAYRGVQGAAGPLHHSVMVYMDDLLCYSPSLEQYLRDVREVLDILRQEKLYVKASKCAFRREELGFLGHRVSGAGVAVDSCKVAAVRQ